MVINVREDLHKADGICFLSTADQSESMKTWVFLDSEDENLYHYFAQPMYDNYRFTRQLPELKLSQFRLHDNGTISFQHFVDPGDGINFLKKQTQIEETREALLLIKWKCNADKYLVDYGD